MFKKTLAQAFAKEVKTLRLAQGLSAATVAQRAGLKDGSQISLVERGENVPGLDTALRIVQALGGALTVRLEGFPVIEFMPQSAAPLPPPSPEEARAKHHHLLEKIYALLTAQQHDISTLATFCVKQAAGLVHGPCSQAVLRDNVGPTIISFHGTGCDVTSEPEATTSDATADADA